MTITNVPLSLFCVLGAVVGVAIGLWILDAGDASDGVAARGGGRRWTTYAVVACRCAIVGVLSLVVGITTRRFRGAPAWLEFVPFAAGLVVVGILVGRFLRRRSGGRVGPLAGVGLAAMLTVLALLGGTAANLTWHVVAGDLFAFED